MNQRLNKSGTIEVICGCMFSGKTEELIRRIRRAQIARMSVVVFKPIIDCRYSKTEIVSHNNDKINSKPITKSIEMIPPSNDYDVIGIDEAQFFDHSLIEVCNNLAKNGKRVVVAGLDKDFAAKSFGPIPQLIIDAEYVTKVNAICMVCGDPASFTQRISTEKSQVVVGETDKYEARCRNCFEI